MSDSAKKCDSTTPDAIKKAVEYGIDIEMLKANLKRTVAERISRHQSALDLVNQLQKARKI
jgi:hypothetical protein